MFEEIKLLAPTEQSIVVQTRKRTNIKNVIEPEPGFPQRRNYQRLREKYGRQWEPRKPATGGYNCAGHVWASRRTALSNPQDWRVILDEDGYRRLPGGEEPRPGDLVLYVDIENDEFLHVGEIVELRAGVAPQAERIAWVLSKLGPAYGELMHYVQDLLSLFADLGFRVRIEYWTDRPLGKGERA